MIKVENLVKKYGGKTALDGISFQVESGQIVGLLGPNGAGKSTTMNIMTGYIPPTKGKVFIDGHDIVKDAIQAKKAIGYLPEIPPLYMDMKVKEYLKFVAKLKKVKGRDRKKQIEYVMEVTGIKEYEKRLIKFLSKGYRQRVGMAQALLGNPKLLILDEPMVGLDPKQIINMRELIGNLAKDRTIILSSHILSEISAICDHIIIMDQGKIAAYGKTTDLEEKFTKKNQLALTVKADADAVREALAGCDLISDFTMEEGEDAMVVRVDTHSEEDIRDQLFFYFAECKIPVLTMEVEGTSLEDIFLKLTEEVDE